MDYDLEIEKAVQKIQQENAKLVCLQLPDGLKQYAAQIQDALEKETDARVLIWAGSCFGSCDVPIELEHCKVDLLVQWGHSEWR